MVWGGISVADRTHLVIINGNLNAAQYRDRVIVPHVQPFMAQHGPGMLLQQDNARPHVAQVVHAHLANQQIETLPWPAVSPDLSPIEHVWDEVERRLRRRQDPANLQQLAVALQDIWNAIPQRQIQRVIHTMRRRCQAVIAARGGHTPF